MTRDKATEIAKDLINKAFLKSEIKIKLSNTVEFQRGWVFFYNTTKYIQHPIPENSVIQSTPILIDKFDGMVYRLFDPTRRFSNKLDWLEDYILMKEYEVSDGNQQIDYTKLDYYKLPKTYEILNEDLMVKLAQEISKKKNEDKGGERALDFLNRNLLDEEIIESVWIRDRLKSKQRIIEIIKKEA